LARGKRTIDGPVDPLVQIARLLAIAVTQSLPAEEAARRLLVVGFDAPTIGGLLGKNPNFANVAKGRTQTKKRGD
jgi:hypothetical protein